jgi:bifunctional non-homologous end joining protein LigD
VSLGLPKIEPVRPVLSKRVPLGEDWTYELKLDGFRGILHVENGRGHFTSKTGRVMKRFEPLAGALVRSLNLQSVILDGEIIVIREGKPDFYALMVRRGQPEYAAFDLLWLNGRDLRMLPFEERKAALRGVLAEQGVIGYVESHAAPALFEATVRLDLEGIVAKRKAAPYSPDAGWVKVKHPAYSQNEGRWELFHRK